MNNPDQRSKENQAVRDYLAEALPGVAEIRMGHPNKEANDRLYTAGIVAASILLNDGRHQHAYVNTGDTPYTRALSQIRHQEQTGALEPGSHTSAIERIEAGDFDILWGEYLPQDSGQ